MVTTHCGRGIKRLTRASLLKDGLGCASASGYRGDKGRPRLWELSHLGAVRFKKSYLIDNYQAVEDWILSGSHVTQFINKCKVLHVKWQFRGAFLFLERGMGAKARDNSHEQVRGGRAPSRPKEREWIWWAQRTGSELNLIWGITLFGKVKVGKRDGEDYRVS